MGIDWCLIFNYAVFLWTKYDNTIDEERVSWFALAWDRQVQVAKFVKSKIIKHKDWKLDSAAVGVAWLDDQVCKMLPFVAIHLVSVLFLVAKLNYSFFFRC